MPAAEPHPRRRAACRALATVLASVVVLFAVPGAPAGAGQLLPTTTEPSSATTEPEPELTPTTTTTEAEPAPTTTDAPRATTTTGRAAVQDAEVDREGDGAVGDAGDQTDDQVDDQVDDDPVEDEVPAETTSTARDLLVGGDGTDGAESTTTTSTTVLEAAADDGTVDEETQIWLIVAGLVVVAALIGVWTWRYWVRTRPVPIDGGPDDTTVFAG